MNRHWAHLGVLVLTLDVTVSAQHQAGPEYKLLARNALNGMSLASPAVAGNSLFIRTATKLYRISEAR